MADIYLSSRTGQTVTAQLYDGATPVGTPISMTEIGSTGEYFCDVPAGTAAGKYLVLFLVAGQDIASGPLYWDGTAETMPGVPALGAPAQAATLAALAASTQAEHDATQAAIAGLSLPTLAQIEASAVLAKVSDTLNVNIVKVNNVTVTGTGEEGAEWGPAP